MFKTTAGEEDGHVFIVVAGGVAQVGGEEHHGAVQHFGFLELAEEVAPLIDDGLFDNGELFELVLVFAVVGQSVVAFRDALDAPEFGVTGHVEGGKAGGVGLEGEGEDVEHGLDDFNGVVAVGLGGFGAGVGLGLVDPTGIHLEPGFQVAYTGEPGVELALVPRSEFAFEGFGFVANDVEHASPAFDEGGLAGLFLLGVVDEELGKDFGHALFGWYHGAIFRVGGAGGSTGVEDEGGEAGFMAEVLGHELVQGDGVFARAALVGAGGEDAAFGGVAPANAGVGAAGDYGHVLAEVFEGLEIFGGFVFFAFALGYPVFGVEA